MLRVWITGESCSKGAGCWGLTTNEGEKPDAPDLHRFRKRNSIEARDDTRVTPAGERRLNLE